MKTRFARVAASGGGLLLAFALLSCVASVSSCALMPGYSSAADIAAENLAIADGYAGLSNFDKAAFYYKKAARVKAYRNAAQWGLARSSAMSGDWDTAVTLLEGLLRQDGANRLVKEAFAYALVKKGDTERGLALYKAITEEDPENATAAVNYAEALCIAGKWEESLSAAKDARERFPEAGALSRLDAIESKCETELGIAQPAPAGEAETPPETDTASGEQ